MFDRLVWSPLIPFSNSTPIHDIHMDHHALSFKKTCHFMHVVLDGITTCLIKACNFNHLFKHTFLCDDAHLWLVGNIGKCLIVWRHVACTTHYFHRVLYRCTLHSAHFAQCTHFKGCQHPNLNLTQQSTTRDKWSVKRRLDSILSGVGTKETSGWLMHIIEMLVMARASLIGQLRCGKNRTNIWDTVVLVELFCPIRIFTAMTFVEP